jgi:hypothetical protein
MDSIELKYSLFPDLNVSGNYLIEVGRDSNSDLTESHMQTQLLVSNIFPCPPSYTQNCGDLLRNGGFTYTARSFSNSDDRSNGIARGLLCEWEAAFNTPQYNTFVNPNASMWAINDIQGKRLAEGMKTSVNIQIGKTYVITCSLKVPTDLSVNMPNQFNAMFVKQSSLTSYTGTMDIDEYAMGTPPGLAGQKAQFYNAQINSNNIPDRLGYKVYSVCIQANDNYDKLMIFPESPVRTYVFHDQIEVDDVSMRELTLDAGPDYLCQVTSAVIGPNCILPGASYAWTPTTGLSDPNIANPIATPLDYTVYTLTMTFDGSSCSITDQVAMNPEVPDYILTNKNVSWMKNPTNGIPYVNGPSRFGPKNYSIFEGKTFQINGVFTVDENISFRNCRIIMGENARINVVSGELIIEGDDPENTIQSCDPNAFWDGIYVNPSNTGASLVIRAFPFYPTYKIKFANSMNGIVAMNDPEIIIQDAIFDRNNRVFTIDPIVNAQNLINFQFNEVDCSQPIFIQNEWKYPITSIKVDNAEYGTGSLYNIILASNLFQGKGGSVEIINSDVKFENNTYKNFTNSSGILVAEKAINIIGSTNSSSRKVLIRGDYFYSNNTGIHVQDNIGLEIVSSLVNYIDQNTVLPIIPNSKFLKVSNNMNNVIVTAGNNKTNEIYNVQTGIEIHDCIDVTIENVYMDLEYQGNGVTSYTSKTNKNSVGISFNNTGVEFYSLPYASKFENNTIKHSKNGILADHGQVDIIDNTILDLNDNTDASPFCPGSSCPNTPGWGIRANNLQTKVTGNKVYNDQTHYTTTPQANTRLTGIELVNSGWGLPEVNCNNIESTGVAMKFTGDNSGGEILKNKMNDHTYGFVLDINGIVGNVGSSGNASQNQWTGSYSVSNTFAFNSNGSLSNFFVQSGAPYNPVIVTGDHSSTGGYPSSAMVKTITTAATNSGCTTRARVRNNTANANAPSFSQFQNGKNARGKQPFMVYASDSALQFNQQLLFFNLSKDSALMNSPVWKQFSDSMRTTPIGKTVGKPLNTAGRGAITVGTPTNFDANLTLINPIAEHYKNGMQLTKLEMAQLQDMAIKCPYFDGFAVYQARYLISMLGGERVYNNCESIDVNGSASIGNASKRIKGEEESTLTTFAIYPNPTKEMIFLNFEVDEKDNVTFELYDVLGKQQTISRLSATNQHQIKLSNVQPGIYFYRLVNNNASIEAGKLIIE